MQAAFDNYDPENGDLDLSGLNITDDILTSIQNRIESLPMLTRLDLSDNQLTIAPNFNLPMLTHLYLDNNQIASFTCENSSSQTSVPNFDLPMLTRLYLDNNQLTSIPNFDLPKLTNLSLHDNRLTSVPNFNLPKLTYLCLHNNRLTSVPNFDLPKLTELYLYNNRLTTVPNFDLPMLTILYLHNNQLDWDSRFPFMIYSSNDNRLYLHISVDQIDNIFYHIERNIVINIYENGKYIDKTKEIQEQNKNNIIPSRIKRVY